MKVNSNRMDDSQHHLAGTTWLCRLTLVLILSTATTSLALRYVLPEVPSHKTNPQRLAWYVTHGQLTADMRTLAHAVTFLLA